MVKTFDFSKLANAKKIAKYMEKHYGYKPKIFRVKNPMTNKSKFVVVKPKGLIRIKW